MALWLETDQISGIPQGNSIGPLCFLIYISDLPLNIKHRTIKLFADDVKLYFDFVRNDILSTQANWAKLWQLDISIPKTFILHLGSNNPKLSYFIDGKLR
jgi:Reverse transcriptase (RNA-dependent DNA polymerase)